jgi:signal recognition particle subunit SRP54
VLKSECYVFEALSSKLSGVFDKLRSRGALNETDVMEALREVRLALLDADVALPAVRDFITKVRERAVGQEVIGSVSPGQQVVKIVNDVMVEALGGAGAEPLNFNAVPPVPVLMVGLQGSGKTTTSGKLALRLARRDRKKVLLASLDTQRPAAQLQLQNWRSRPASPACRSSPARPRCRSPNARWRPGGARSTMSSSSIPPAGCRSMTR